MLRRTPLWLAVGIVFGTTFVGRAQNAPDPRVETFATLPSAGATENIGQAADGSIYITGMDDKVLWKVTPAGQVEKFADVPGVAAVLGVAPADNGVVATAFLRPFRRPAPAAAQAPAAGAAGAPAAPALQIDFSDVGTEILVFDKSGKVTATIPGQKGQAFNGITSAGNGKFLIADSNAGTIWQVDPAKQQIDPWIKDDVLAPSGTVPIGANGVKAQGGWVYVSVTGRGAIYRVQMDSNGRPQGTLKMFAEGFRPDDFDVAKDGSLYSSSGTTMYKVSPDGQVTKLLENVPGGPATLVSRDGRWVYWPTRGGAAPQRLLRTAIR